MRKSGSIFLECSAYTLRIKKSKQSIRFGCGKTLMNFGPEVSVFCLYEMGICSTGIPEFRCKDFWNIRSHTSSTCGIWKISLTELALLQDVTVRIETLSCHFLSTAV